MSIKLSTFTSYLGDALKIFDYPKIFIPLNDVIAIEILNYL